MLMSTADGWPVKARREVTRSFVKVSGRASQSRDDARLGGFARTEPQVEMRVYSRAEWPAWGGQG